MNGQMIRQQLIIRWQDERIGRKLSLAAVFYIQLTAIIFLNPFLTALLGLKGMQISYVFSCI